MILEFTYQLTIAGVTHSVAPAMPKDTRIVSTINDTFAIERELSEKVVFAGADYDLILANQKEPFILTIFRYGAKYFEIYFTIFDCEIDYDNRLIKAEGEENSLYNRIKDKMNIEIDLAKQPMANTVIESAIKPIIQVYQRGSTVITNIQDGFQWEESVSQETSSIVLKDDYHYNLEGFFAEVSIEKNNSSFDVETSAVVSEALENNWESFTASNSLWSLNSQMAKGIATVTSIRYEAKYLPTNEVFIGLINNPENGEYQEVVCSTTDGKSVKITRYKTSEVYARVLLGDVSNVSIPNRDIFDMGTDDMYQMNLNYWKILRVSDRPLVFATTQADYFSPDKYGVNDYGAFFKKPSLISCVQTSKTDWANASFWARLDAYDFLSDYDKKYLLRDNYSLLEVFKAIFKILDEDIIVTENSSSLFIQELYLTAKSNAIKAEYETAAQKIVITPDSLMTSFSNIFNYYWMISDANELIFESKNYFLTKVYETIDVSNMDNIKTKKNILLAQNKVSFSTESLYSSLLFYWPEDCSDYFNLDRVVINNTLLEPYPEKTTSESLIDTDLSYLLTHRNSVSMDGLALIKAEYEPERGTNRTVQMFEGVVDGVTFSFLNGALAWRNLIQKHLLEIPAETVTIDGEVYQVLLKSRIKKQEIILNSSRDILPRTKIITTLGTALVESTEVDLESRETKLTIGYEYE